MDRKEFIFNCGPACLGMLGVAGILASCTPVRSIQATAENNIISLALSEFPADKKESAVIVKTDALQFPIVVYKLTSGAYSAMLLQCSHQGVELSVNGNLLSCPAHGSEFNSKGQVTQGPAEQNLKTFITKVSQTDLKIYLS